jgi:hypothetical protein
MSLTKYILPVILFIGIGFANTSKYKSFYIPKGSVITFPEKDQMKLTWDAMLFEKNLSIKIGKDANQATNVSILQGRLRLLESLTETLNRKIENRDAKIANLEMINKINVDYMETAQKIFGEPYKSKTRGTWMFPLGIGTGAIIMALSFFLAAKTGRLAFNRD